MLILNVTSGLNERGGGSKSSETSRDNLASDKGGRGGFIINGWMRSKLIVVGTYDFVMNCSSILS